MNCNYLVLNDHVVIKDAIRENGFKQLISKPTRITKNSKTLIDIIITTDSSKIVDSIVYANSCSDHDLVGIVRKMNVKKYVPRKIFVRDYSKYNRNTFKDELRNVPWENCLKQPDVNSAWNMFKRYVTTAVDTHTPLVERKIRGKENPWMSREIKIKMNSRDYYLRRAKRSNSEVDWSTYKRMRNNVTCSLRQAKSK